MSLYIQISRGDSIVLNGMARRGRSKEDLTGASLFFTVKEDLADTDNDAILAKDLSSGITIVDAALGTFSIFVAASDTDSITPGLYEYDIQIKTSAGEVFTMTSGGFEVKADVTRRTS